MNECCMISNLTATRFLLCPARVAGVCPIGTCHVCKGCLPGHDMRGVRGFGEKDRFGRVRVGE
jgi:hypothetical protein